MVNLFQRVFFDKDSLPHVPTETGFSEIMPLKKVEENMSVALEPIAMVGGKVRKNRMEYFQRWNLYFFIFFLAVFVAILTMPTVTKGLLKKADVKDMSSGLDKDPKIRWKRIIHFTIVFVVFVLVYFIAFMVGVNLWQGLAGVFVDKVTPFSELFWKYKDPFGENVEIGKTLILTLAFVLFVSFVFYLGFSKWFPDYFEGLYYQSTLKKKDDKQPQRYIYNYGLFLIAMMTLFIILINVKMLGDNQLYMFYNFAFYLGFMIMAFIIIKEFRYGKHEKLAFLIILAFLAFFLYPVLISLIKMEKGGGDILNSKFVTNVIFNFGLP